MGTTSNLGDSSLIPQQHTTSALPAAGTEQHLTTAEGTPLTHADESAAEQSAVITHQKHPEDVSQTILKDSTVTPLKGSTEATAKKADTIFTDFEAQQQQLETGKKEMLRAIPGAANVATVRVGAAAQMAKQTELKPLGKSVNLVTQGQTTQGQTYFAKVGARGETAAAKMEKLMYNTAVVLGLGDQFVPTTTMKVHLEGDLTEKPLERDPATGQHIVPEGMKKVSVWVESKLVKVADEEGQWRGFITEDVFNEQEHKNPGKLKLLVQDSEGNQSFKTKQEIEDSEGLEVVKELRRELEVYGSKSSTVAGIQPAQEGITVRDYLEIVQNEAYDQFSEGQEPLGKEALIDGMLTTLKMGMYDAHDANMILTIDGKVLFFDNTRSLAHGTGLIKNEAGGLISPFRSGLLELPESFEELTPEELEKCRSNLEESLVNIDTLEKYLDSPTVKKEMENLPNGWYDQKKIVGAMRQRTENMLNAINNSQVTNLVDLTFAANPVFKLVGVLEMLRLLKNDGIELESLDETELGEISQSYLMGAGVTTVVGLEDDVPIESRSDTLSEAYNAGYDVQQIEEWCNDPNMSLEDIFRGCQAMDREAPRDEVKYNAVRERLIDGAELDNKDLSRGTIQAIRVADLQRLGYAVLTVNERTSEKEMTAPAFKEKLGEAEKSIVLVKREDGNSDYMLFKGVQDGKVLLEKIDAEKFIKDLKKAARQAGG